MRLPSKPFLASRPYTPVVTDGMLRLLVQAARVGPFVLEFGPNKGRAADPEGVEHRRVSVKSWGLRGLLHVRWNKSIATVEITEQGRRYLRYVRDLADAGCL